MPVDLVVLHGTAGRTDAGDLSWCCDPKSQVSYHYLIGRDERIYQLVDEGRRAWHAGASKFNKRTDGRNSVNGFSIGVAFCNKGDSKTIYRPGEPFPEPFTDGQYDAGAWLVADIWRRRGIGFEGITEHRAVSPGRKTDPWDHFDMQRFFVAVANYRFPPPDPIALRAA